MNQNLLELNIKIKMRLRLGEIKKLLVKIINELEVKKCPEKKQPIIQQPKFTTPNCPSLKRNNWLEFDQG